MTDPPRRARSVLGVLNENPGNRLAIIGRHAISLCDRGGSARRAINLPHPALGADFSSASACTNGRFLNSCKRHCSFLSLEAFDAQMRLLSMKVIVSRG